MSAAVCYCGHLGSSHREACLVDGCGCCDFEHAITPPPRQQPGPLFHGLGYKLISPAWPIKRGDA